MAKKTITVRDAKHKIEEIEAAVAAHDFEKAHGLEDELHLAALKAIAKNPSLARELATIVLSTEKLDFDRWCG